MDIIIVIILGFVLLLFILMFQKRNNKGINVLMRQNRNVQPLFRRATVLNKYQTLYSALDQQPEAQSELAKLHQEFTDKKITLSVYYDKLDELAREHANVG